MRRRWRILFAVLGLAAALTAVVGPAVYAQRLQERSCVDLPAVWCEGAP